jgi:hypothetical protein
LAPQEVHKINFSFGIFPVIGPWSMIGGESLSPTPQKQRVAAARP